MKILHAFIALLFVSIGAKAQSKINNVELNFGKALDRAGLTFRRPMGAVEVPIIKNREVSYQYALKYPTRNLEIRYKVVPFAGKKTPIKPSPNGQVLGTVDADIIKKVDIYSKQLATNAGGGIRDTSINMGGFPPAEAKKEFGADRVTFWMVRIKNKSFATSYKFCNMVAIHKDNVGDAYIFYLCNSLQELTKNFKEIGPYNIYYSLKFKD